VQPDNIILVHGTEKEMKKLKNQLERDLVLKPTITMPANLQSITYQFSKQIAAELVGSLADTLTASGGSIDELKLTEPVLIATENFNTKAFKIIWYLLSCSFI